MRSKLYLMLICTILFAANSCRKHDKPDLPDRPTPPKEGVLVKTSLFGRVVGEDDKPLQGVTISAGGASTVTDEDGIYTLKDIMLDEARGYLRATKTGYFNGSRVFVSIKDNTTYPTLIKLIPLTKIGTINSSSGGTVTAPNGMKLELPANAVEGYSGQINVVGSYMNPTSADFFARMPGNLGSVNSRGERGILLSFGMAKLDLLDAQGNQVKIKSGAQATITFPVPKGLEAPATIPMWYFNEEKGIWVEEGSGTLKDGAYTGKVAHFSDWNFDAQPPPLDQITRMKILWDPNYLGLISDLPNMDPLAMRLRRLRLIHQVRYKGQLIHSEIIPVPMPAPGSNTTEFSFTRQIIGHPGNGSAPKPEDIKSTVHLSQGGEDNYPKAPDYKPEGPTSTPGSGGNGDAAEEPIKLDEQNVDPDKPEVTHEIRIPPSLGGGMGETIVNVNGKAVDCAGKPVVNGKVRAELRAGNELIRVLNTDIYSGTINGETRSMFTVEYFFSNQLPKKVDNVTVVVSDYTSGKKSKALTVNVNPSVPYMIPDPVRACEDPVVSGPVYNGNYTISNEATLESFVAGNYAQVTGMLSIEGMAVDNLNGINSLQKVGSLQIINSALPGLGPLAQLEQITGSIRIDNNPFIQAADFNALTSKKLTGGIYVSGNPKLTSLKLPNIENITENGQAFNIANCPLLETLYMPALKNINACGSLQVQNTGLVNLDIFENTVGRLPGGGAYGLTVRENKKLQSIRGLKNITIEKSLTIVDNPVLTSLDGIKLADQMQDVYFYVQRNPRITTLTIPCTGMSGGGGVISDNAALTTISIPNATSFPALDISFNPQLASISGPKIKNAGQVAVFSNAKLATLQLPAVEEIPGQFYISNNALLGALDLPALQTVGDRFVIENNPSLKTLNGFNNLKEAKAGIEIRSNDLTELKGFTKLEKAQRWVYIFAVDAPLTAIQGFSSLVEIYGPNTYSNAVGVYGKNITSLAGFKKLQKADGLSVNQTNISNMNDFTSLISLKVLEIRNNPKLTSIQGLSNLATLTSNLYIVQNALLTSVNGLEKITSMPDGGNSSIDISLNASLQNLNGLQNIGSIRGNLNIQNNLGLTSLCGITKLVMNNGIGGGNYYVAGNGYNPTIQDIKDGKCSK